MQKKQLLNEILDAIFWIRFTQNQQTIITKIINDDSIDNVSKANEICEFLDIAKRSNRASIVSVLENQ